MADHAVVGGEAAPGGPPTWRLYANTWLPPLLSTVVGVGVAALGVAIGALRPLGRLSELLLLPFAPWLFVGVAPLSMANFRSAAEGDRLNTFLGLIPPVWVVLPALFLFAVLFRGLADQSGGRLGGTILPAMPMLVLAGGAAWLVQAQDVTWTLLATDRADHVTGPLLALRRSVQYTADAGFAVETAYPVVLVLLFAAVLAVGQLLYLDRLALRTGRQ